MFATIYRLALRDLSFFWGWWVEEGAEGMLY